MHDYEEHQFNGVWYWRDWSTKRWLRMTPAMLMAKVNEGLSQAKH